MCANRQVSALTKTFKQSEGFTYTISAELKPKAEAE
jgi:hypothetical protein